MSQVIYDDAELLARLRGRDHAAQLQVWRVERESLLALAARILGSRSEAETLVADLFTDFLYRYVDQVRQVETIPSYLRIMVIRRGRRRKDRALREVDLEAADLVSDSSPALPGVIDDKRQLGALEECLDRLNLRARGMLKLHYGHDQSYSEIGAALGVSKQAVGKTIQKSLDALRRCLAKRGKPEQTGQSWMMKRSSAG